MLPMRFASQTLLQVSIETETDIMVTRTGASRRRRRTRGFLVYLLWIVCCLVLSLPSYILPL
jgi:hypothetical protein